MGKEIPFKYLVTTPERCIYPGYKGSGRIGGNNLVSYNERVTPWGEDHIIDSWLQFDIERDFSWDEHYNLGPYTYSMMINAYYPTTRRFGLVGPRINHPSQEEFETIAQGMPGFSKSEPRPVWPIVYTNLDRNVFTDWAGSTTNYPSRTNIGVIQKEHALNIDVVLNDITPYAAEAFNRLSPTRQISPEVLEKVIALAWEANKITPRCRIPECDR
jgi:hypothetical protein